MLPFISFRKRRKRWPRRRSATSRSRRKSPDQPVGRLSGGNQQKVVIGRWLQSAPKVLILDEPTRGVDIGARGEIHRLIRDLAAKGMAVLVISSEPDELPDLCDRVLVMAEGRIVRELAGAARHAQRDHRGELCRRCSSERIASMSEAGYATRRLSPSAKAALGVFARYGTIFGLVADDRGLLVPVAARLPDASTTSSTCSTRRRWR